MSFITKPTFVEPKTKILASDINKIIQGLIDTENYLENVLGLVTDHIEYGKVQNVNTSNNGIFTYQISFSKQFTNLPVVLLTLENVDVDVDLMVWVSNVTLSGFVLNVKVIKKKANTSCNVSYLAVA